MWINVQCKILQCWVRIRTCKPLVESQVNDAIGNQYAISIHAIDIDIGIGIDIVRWLKVDPYFHSIVHPY